MPIQVPYTNIIVAPPVRGADRIQTRLRPLDEFETLRQRGTPSLTGAIRLINDTLGGIGWRNAGDTADQRLYLNTSNEFTLEGPLVPDGNQTRDLGKDGLEWQDIFTLQIFIAALLDIEDSVADPTLNGNFRRNGNDVKVFSGGAVRNLTDIATGGGAPVGSPFVTIGNDGTLTAERALTGTSNQITVTDNGVNSTVVLSTPQDIHTGASPTFGGLTLNGAADFNGNGIVDLGNIIPDLDSTQDIGTNLVRWRELFVDTLTLTNDLNLNGSDLTNFGALLQNGTEATVGAVRLTNNTGGAVSWRNAGNTADHRLYLDTSNRVVVEAQFIPNGNQTVDLGADGLEWQDVFGLQFFVAGLLEIEDSSTDPSANGDFRRNGNHVKVFSNSQVNTLTLAAARVRDASTQSISNDTFTPINLDTEDFDTDAIHDTVTNNTRLTAKTAGKYLITGIIEYAANATGNRATAIRLNGITFIAETLVPNAGSGTLVFVGTTTIYDLAVNDYVELMAFQTSGGNLNSVVSGSITPQFSMFLIG